MVRTGETERAGISWRISRGTSRRTLRGISRESADHRSRSYLIVIPFHNTFTMKQSRLKHSSQQIRLNRIVACQAPTRKTLCTKIEKKKTRTCRRRNVCEFREHSRDAAKRSIVSVSAYQRDLSVAFQSRPMPFSLQNEVCSASAVLRRVQWIRWIEKF